MLAAQSLAKPFYPVDEVLATLAVMMNVDLYVRNSLTNHLCQRFHESRMIFLFRKEKRIAGRVPSSVRAASLRDLRPRQSPHGDA
jgi:hypothetical protein